MTYSDVRKIRDQKIKTVSANHFTLNQFHDELMLKVIKIAILKIMEENGPVPASFSFFVMGSAGRFEQAIWSDQDNGIIYDETTGDKNAQPYFLRLGEEISRGLAEAGYEYCDGHVMASNPLWCKSLSDWKKQLHSWIGESSWESIRNLLILIDGRSIYGESGYVDLLKNLAYESIHENKLIQRIMHNTMYLRKGIGVLGQFLLETHGPYAGALNIKDRVFFPYINSVRLLAIKERIPESSTLLRLEKLTTKEISDDDKGEYKQQFIKLLDYRLKFIQHSDYQAGHYLFTRDLTKGQRKELKQIIRAGLTLYHHARKIVERKDRIGHE